MAALYISSIVRFPQTHHAVGSGLKGLKMLLSQTETNSATVPSGTVSGSAR